MVISCADPVRVGPGHRCSGGRGPVRNCGNASPQIAGGPADPPLSLLDFTYFRTSQAAAEPSPVLVRCLTRLAGPQGYAGDLDTRRGQRCAIDEAVPVFSCQGLPYGR